FVFFFFFQAEDGIRDFSRDWSSDVCSSDLRGREGRAGQWRGAVMLRASLKGMLSRKLRLVLSALAVVLGVMFVSGAFVLTDTIGRSVDQLIATAYDKVDVAVPGAEATGGETAPIPADVVDQIRAMPEAADVRAEVWGLGAKAISNDTGKVVSTFSLQIGSNWAGENDVVQLREGRGPAADDEVAIN